MPVILIYFNKFEQYSILLISGSLTEIRPAVEIRLLKDGFLYFIDFSLELLVPGFISVNRFVDVFLDSGFILGKI